MDTKYCSWAPSSRRCRHTPQSQHHRSPGHRWGRWSHKLPQRCQSGRGLRTWAPASQAHSADSAQCLADRPLQAGSGGTAACSSPQRCQEGRAGGTGSHSSLARRPRSCLCLQSMAYSACTGHSWEEKEFREPWEADGCRSHPGLQGLESILVPAGPFGQV